MDLIALNPGFPSSYIQKGPCKASLLAWDRRLRREVLRRLVPILNNKTGSVVGCRGRGAGARCVCDQEGVG